MFPLTVITSGAHSEFMPGIATQFVILERVINRMSASGDAALQDAATVITDNLGYAYLGAVGPALADFIPSDPPASSGPSIPSSPYTSLWAQVLAIAGGDGTATDPGALHVIGEFTRILDRLDVIVADEDLGALIDLRDSGDAAAIETLATQLKTVIDGLLPRVAAIGAAIVSGMRPGVNAGVGNSTPPPLMWTAREWLHWKHPGRFADSLMIEAKNSGDERFLAYAYGYLCSFAGCVVVNPFVNSTIGASYRQQWWRTRWVFNYIDAWVHGAYATPATMSGDTPSPPYAQWVPLCDAELHKRIELVSIDPVAIMAGLRRGDPFPAVLPDDFAEFWITSWNAAYGAVPLSKFQKGALNGAYLMTYMKLWFQTSGQVIGCPTQLGAPPGDCGGAPSWVDPNVPGDAGGAQGPSVPEPESDPDVGEIVTGIILALLGVAAFLAGGWVAGAAAVAAGIALVIDGATEINWAKLRCDLYWLRQYLNNGLRALHDLLTLGGFSHPYPSELALDTTTTTLMGIPYTYDSGKRLTRSRRLFPENLIGELHDEPSGDFPSKPSSGSLGTWVQVPTAANPGIEQPETTAYLVERYPSYVIDDDVDNPVTGDTDVKSGAAWPPGVRLRPGSNVPVTFGNAVDNAVDLILNAGAGLPDWNLDADRGLASLTWQFVASTYTDPVHIEEEP